MKNVIVSLAYNRPDCERECINHLEACKGIENYKVFFFVEPCDCEVLDIIKASNLDKEIILNNSLKGLWVNKKEAVRACMKMTDFIIVIEDDVLLSSDALEYFEWAKKTFNNDESIKTVTAYNFLDGEYHDALSHEVQARQWYNSTAWAIWKSRYETLSNWTGEDRDLMQQLHIGQNGYEVFPLLSRANNIGFVNGIKSCAKEVLAVTGLENSYATIGVSRNATKDNVYFVGDKESYLKHLESINNNKVVSDLIDRCNRYSFDDQLIINELGQECIKLDDKTYKSRDNEEYRLKYFLSTWYESEKPEIKEFIYTGISNIQGNI